MSKSKSSIIKARPASIVEVEAAARGIALTMIVTFGVTFALLYWKQRPAHTLLPATFQPLRIAAPAPLGALPAAAEHARDVKPSAQAPLADEQLKVVPVDLHVRFVHRENRVEGSVKNLSPHPLSMILVGENREGDETARVAILLNPYESKSFNTDDEMDLRSGGHVSAQSQGYQERNAPIP
jgi:hypothetical protein